MIKKFLPLKRIITNTIRTIVLIFGVLSFFSENGFGQINMSSNSSYSQNFDGLINTGTGTWADNSTIANWYAQRSVTGTTIITAGTGSSNAGGLYSFGTTDINTKTDRALGSVGSSAAGNFAYGVLLQNTSGSTITEIKVSYTLEQWRNSGDIKSQGDTFYYKIDSKPITTLNPNANTGWTMVTELIANSPVIGGTSGSLDGNTTGNRVVLTNVKIPGLSLANNEYILLKWDDRDNSGADHGLAIDDVTIAWTVSGTPSPTVPAAPTISTITPGNGQLSVAFTAGSDGGAAISNYEYSTNAGQTWTLSSPAQTISPIVITGLTNGTPYNVQIRAVNSVGSGAASPTVIGTPAAPANPSLSASTLNSFVNVCVNTTSGPNSFTVSGSLLTPENITVGPLSGYTFSNASNGTYTSTLTIDNATGGTLASTTVFVKFNPTAIQSYNGNIPVSGGGATAINVAVVGAGINTSASATTGTSSSITSSGVILAGSYIQGCTAVTSYGIEYSTTAGFTPASGIKIVSNNQSAGAYTSTLTGLTASTTYYYVAYATTSAGTVYGTPASFTTATVGPQPASVIAAWDFNGSSSIATLAATTFNSNLVSTNSLNEITRGPGAAASTGANSFRTIGFKNDGISTDNTDYFQTTLQTAAGYSLSLSSINAKFAGTASFYANPGVTSQFAYSLDGNNFTLIGTPLTSTLLTFSADVSGVADLQNIPSGTIVYIRYYASGQTATGGWGFNSPSAGSNGLEYTGSVKVEVVGPRIIANPKSLSFGKICNNNTSGPNSFTVSGSLLTPGNITVGPLSGYTFSNASNGAYTSTLTIDNATGGTLAPTTVFVKLSPTAIQSYNGNIPVSGGGATTVNVAATGSGSDITLPIFNLPASICSGSAYTLPTTSTNGITGTWSPAFDNTNTKEYTFTPGASQCADPTKLTVTVNTKTTPIFTQVAPICTGGSFTLPTTSDNGINGTWSPAYDFTKTTEYTFTPDGFQCADVAKMTVVVSEIIIETVVDSATTRNSAILKGSINSQGCSSSFTEYGFEYSPINAFVNGTGKQVPSNNVNGTSFFSLVNGLVQNTAYYYKAYAKTADGIIYGDIKLFFTKPIPAGLTIYGSPVLRGAPLRYSLSGLKQGHYAARIFDLNGRLVYKKEIINQLNFIDDSFILPAKLPPGVYNLQIFSTDFKINRRFLAL